ncbi:hypothetical protein KM914_16335, partial [Virgibacillus pantothenticus]|uniref:hypothetical protein n=1 Tax=Virgibacillus pantothenticus TaxID=1473 RepID=UPI001C234551
TGAPRLCSTIGKYKIFLVYSIRKTKSSAIRLGDKPSFSNIKYKSKTLILEYSTIKLFLQQ